MKKVAGGLRINLAQFRELEAFAQFGSDLDEATQQSLSRGARLVELLKQGQYVPMSNAAQIVALFAGTAGLIDSVELDRVTEFEAGFVEYMTDNHSDLMATLNNWSTKWNNEMAEEVTGACAKFLTTFNA
jgi:F-type H+-transporting ATPase subunit alpha